MIDKPIDEPKKITLLPTQLQTEVIINQDNQSDIQVYKEILVEKFALAKTAEEYERLIEIRQKVQKLDKEVRQLDYAQKLADSQLQEEEKKLVFQRSQQIVASIVAVGIGFYLIQISPLASLIFLVLGLAKSLGYSLGEVGSLLYGLKEFPKSSGELLSNKNEQEIQSEDSENAEF